ncbi:MAG TPA: T9SS type A sorting domain-containing protein [Puia sp.]|jgi:hypothetical protein|nr:T9SS type A sorting domain-containing protein [Puia sp.]
MNPKLPLRLAGILFLLASPFLSYCCDVWISVAAVPLTGNCSTKFSFSYQECPNTGAVYYVEYSTDGNTNDFYIISQVTPNGSGSYSYTDNNAHPQSSAGATVYYRAIYYIPSTGYTNYSPIAAVTLGTATCSNNNVTRCNGLPNFSINGPTGVCWGPASKYTISGAPPYPVTWSLGTNGGDVTMTQTLTGASVTTNATNGYFVLIANEEGCDSKSDQIYLDIPPGPTSMTPAYGTTVKAGAQYDFYSAPANWWLVTNGTIVYGQGTNDLGVQVANLTSGTLTVTAEIIDPCGTSPQLIYNFPITSSGGGGGGGTRFSSDSVTVSGMSIDPATIKLGVYPNPVTNSVQVTIAPTDYSKSFIKLYDLNGHLLKAIVPVGQTTQVDMSQQSKGIYVMEIFDGKQRTIQKVIRL